MRGSDSRPSSGDWSRLGLARTRMRSQTRRHLWRQEVPDLKNQTGSARCPVQRAALTGAPHQGVRTFRHQQEGLPGGPRCRPQKFVTSLEAPGGLSRTGKATRPLIARLPWFRSACLHSWVISWDRRPGSVSERLGHSLPTTRPPRLLYSLMPARSSSPSHTKRSCRS